MSRGTRVRGWPVVLAALACAAPAAAQVASPRAAGVAIPSAYYARLAQDPHAFTLPNGLFKVGPSGAPEVKHALGEKRMLVIPALFADSPDPPLSSQEIEQVLFTGPASRGTLTDAYLEMSQGKLRVDGDVAPWVRTSLTLKQVVGTGDGLGEDSKVGQYLIDALTREDATIDFGKYDNDGPDGIPNSGDDDGVVDAVSFEFAEVAASCGGPGIWPHMWGISGWTGGEPYVTNDKRPDGSFVKVDAYIVESAMDCSGTQPQSVGTVAHEFGHVLGLPDFYNTSGGNVAAAGRQWVLGCWELMAAGAWGCGPVGSTREAFGPTHMSAYPKEQLGWVNFVDVPEVRDKEYDLEPMETTGRPLRIPLDAQNKEYLLLEYRTQTGFDAELPASGVMIYHQDNDASLHPTAGLGLPFFLSVVEQDHNDGLVRDSAQGGNRGEAGDAWGVGGVPEKLSYATTPVLKLDAGGSTPVTIHSVAAEGDKAVVWLSTATTPMIMPPTDTVPVAQGQSFQRRLLITGGYMPYAVEGALPEGVTASADGDELSLSGAVSESGPSVAGLRVTDAKGSVSPVLVYPLVGGTLAVGESQLVQPFLLSDAQPLSSSELDFLDASGNANGSYDVGDLRAWLRTHPAAAPGR